MYLGTTPREDSSLGNKYISDLNLRVRFPEFFIVLLVFLLESTKIWAIPGIPRNGILVVLPAKIIIFVPANSRIATGITGIELHPELIRMEFGEFFLIVIVIFKSNSNYSLVITVN